MKQLALLIALTISTACIRSNELGELPDKRLTPGAVFEGVTVAQVCTPGYARSVRNVPTELKREVYRRYHMAYVRGAAEVDHLIPLSDGGSNSINNLWPEPYVGEWNALVKDSLESKIHQMVCDGQMSLPDAQQRIATNWIATYKEVFKTLRPLERHHHR